MRRSAASSSGVHVGERLGAEELDVGCHEAEARRPIVGIVVRARLGGGDLEHRVRRVRPG